MLDSEGTIKIKVTSPWAVSEISFTSAVICILRVLHGKEVSSCPIRQNYKSHKVDQVHFIEFYKLHLNRKH